MSAVSPEPRRASANLPGSARDQQANGAAGPPGQAEGDGQDEAVPAAAAADFGPNEALVDELYQRSLNDPASVDRAWWNFFADYRPTSGGARQEQAAGEKPAAGPGAPTWPQAEATGITAAAPAAPPRPAAAPPRHRRPRCPAAWAAGLPKASSPAIPLASAPGTPGSRQPGTR